MAENVQEIRKTIIVFGTHDVPQAILNQAQKIDTENTLPLNGIKDHPDVEI